MTQQNRRLPGAPEGKVRLNLVRSITTRAPDGGTETYGPGIVDVPPSVAYSVSLMPEYVETDGVGNPLPHTIEARDPATQFFNSMPAPDVAFAQGIDFNADAIARQKAAIERATGESDDETPKGADRQGGRLNAEVDDSPLLNLDKDHEGKQPGQREYDATDKAQLTQEVARAQHEHNQRVAIGEHDDDAPLRISERAQEVAEEQGDETEGGDASAAFKHFSEASEGAGDPRASEGSSKPARRSASKRSTSKRSGAKKRGAKRRSSPRKTRASESDDE
jgi:hypothetical protein